VFNVTDKKWKTPDVSFSNPNPGNIPTRGIQLQAKLTYSF